MPGCAHPPSRVQVSGHGRRSAERRRAASARAVSRAASRSAAKSSATSSWHSTPRSSSGASSGASSRSPRARCSEPRRAAAGRPPDGSRAEAGCDGEQVQRDLQPALLGPLRAAVRGARLAHLVIAHERRPWRHRRPRGRSGRAGAAPPRRRPGPAGGASPDPLPRSRTPARGGSARGFRRPPRRAPAGGAHPAAPAVPRRPPRPRCLPDPPELPARQPWHRGGRASGSVPGSRAALPRALGEAIGVPRSRSWA